MGAAYETLRKGESKQYRRDNIDRALRKCSSGQTVGVPIGPDASFVAAEVVLTAVDNRLLAEIPSLRGFRYLDDYEAAFKTRAEAEEAQSVLEGALGDFELVVNPFKTHILELPQPLAPSWTHRLAAFTIRDSPTQALNDTIALFSYAAEVATRHHGALTYALRKCSDVVVERSMWSVFQSLVWSAVSVEPTTMAIALDLLTVKSSDAGEPISKKGATEVVEALIFRNAPLRNGSEIAWALWAAILLQLSLSADCGKAVSAMEDDFVALLALHARGDGLFESDGLDPTSWEALVDYDGVLAGDHWLLAYEGAAQGWLTAGQAQIRDDPFFATLADRGVRFYDRTPVRDPFTGPAAPLPGAHIPESYL